MLDHYSESCLKYDTYTSWSQSHYRQPDAFSRTSSPRSWTSCARSNDTCSCALSLTSRACSTGPWPVSRALSITFLEHFPPWGLTEKQNIQKLRKLSCNTLRFQFHVIKINDNQEEVLRGGKGYVFFFSGFRYMKEPLWVGAGGPIWKGNVFTRWNIWKGREIYHFGKQKRSKRTNRWILWL